MVKHRGVEQLVARQAHNLEVACSSPASATTSTLLERAFSFVEGFSHMLYVAVLSPKTYESGITPSASPASTTISTLLERAFSFMEGFSHMLYVAVLSPKTYESGITPSASPASATTSTLLERAFSFFQKFYKLKLFQYLYAFSWIRMG